MTSILENKIKLFMRTIISIILLTLCHTWLFAQSWVNDIDFNRPKNACYINDVFVKDYIGFDMGRNSGFSNVKKVSLDKPIIINNVTYYGKTSATCEKNINFTTLQEIQKNKYPDVTGVIIFMIDSYFIMTDVQSYKLDANYIAKCELLHSKDFDAFKDQPEFSIIRVFTNRDRSSRLR